MGECHVPGPDLRNFKMFTLLAGPFVSVSKLASCNASESLIYESY